MTFNTFCTFFTHRNPMRKLLALFLKASSKWFYCTVIVWQKIPGHGCLLSSFQFKIHSGWIQGWASWLVPWNLSLEAGVRHKSNSGAEIHCILLWLPLPTHRENYHILLSCSCQGEWTQLLWLGFSRGLGLAGNPTSTMKSAVSKPLPSQLLCQSLSVIVDLMAPGTRGK